MVQLVVLRVRYNVQANFVMRRDLTSILKEAVEGLRLVSGGSAFQILGGIPAKVRLYVIFLAVFEASEEGCWRSTRELQFLGQIP